MLRIKFTSSWFFRMLLAVMLIAIGGDVVKGQKRCSAATGQTSAIVGVCLFCGITDPGASTDNILDNFTRISLSIGVLSSGYQRLTFPNSGIATDSIRVDLATTSGLSNINVLGGITLKVLSGTTERISYPLNSTSVKLKLVEGNRFTATFPATGTYDRIEVNLGAAVAALSNVDIYGADIILPNPTISDQTICSGNSIVLNATANGGSSLKWYTAATGGTSIAIGNNYTTPILTNTTTYYIEVLNGICPNPQRFPVKITVNPQPILTTIPAQALCAGQSINLTTINPLEINAVPGGTYTWSTTQGGTALSSTTVTPNLGITNYWVRYTKDGCFSDQQATITVKPQPNITSVPSQNLCAGTSINLTTLNPQETNNVPGGTYTWSLTQGGVALGSTIVTPAVGNRDYWVRYTKDGCYSDQKFTAIIKPQPILTPIPSQSICAGQSIDLLSFNPLETNNAPGGTYTWSTTQGGTALESTTIIPPTGNNDYWVRYTTNGCYSDQKLTITTNPVPSLSVTQSATAIAIGPGTVSLQATASGSSIKWYDQSGTPIGTSNNLTVGPFTTQGTYTFTAIASIGNCTASSQISIYVYSTTVCPDLKQRVYATSQTFGNILTGSITNKDQAVDGNPETKSTLMTGLGLAGIGTVWQNLIFDQKVPAGTPVTVKFSPGTGLLGLATGISVIAFKKGSGTTLIDIGTSQSVDAALLTLLPGENILEYTFVPSNSTSPEAYDGIRIVMGSLLSVANTLDVYDAYYYQSPATLNCAKGDVLDVLYGAVPLAGIGALTSTIGVTDAWKAVDRDESTYATIFSGAGVLAYAKLQVMFSSPSMPGDSIKIVTSNTDVLLSLTLLTGFSIQRYLGNSPVGNPIQNTSNLLTLKLLGSGSKVAIMLAPTTEPYDRIEIRLGGVLGVLTSIRIHEIQRIAATKITGSNLDNNITICQGYGLDLPSPTDACTSFKWYSQASGGQPLGSGLSLNPGTTPGTYTFYIQPVRFNCEVMPRGVVTVHITQKPNPPTFTINSNN